MRTKWGWFPKEDAFGGGEFLLSLTTPHPDTLQNADFFLLPSDAWPIINTANSFVSLQLGSLRSVDHGLL